MSQDDVYAALYKLQGIVRGVKKDKANSHFKNRYATLEAVTDTIRPHMQECGLVWLQTGGAIRDGAIEVTTRIHHPSSGTFHEATMEMPLGKRDPQGAGSALTYAMRYSLMAILGLPPTDDDAETAIDRNDERPAPAQNNAPTKSSASLKREGAWDEVMAQLHDDFADCHSLVTLSKLRADYRAKARDNGWTKAWLEALKNEFDNMEEALTKVDALQAGE